MASSDPEVWALTSRKMKEVTLFVRPRKRDRGGGWLSIDPLLPCEAGGSLGNHVILIKLGETREAEKQGHGMGRSDQRSSSTDHCRENGPTNLHLGRARPF